MPQDPVLLPDSNITVDRATIERHLMSSKTDPFNRSPLTLDAVKPNTTLKVCFSGLPLPARVAQSEAHLASDL